MGIRAFYLERLEDESGVSGTGKVAEGVEFSDGKCVLNWLSKISSMAIYPNIKVLESVHGHGGKTVVVWEDKFVAHETLAPKSFWDNQKIIDEVKKESEELKEENSLLREKLQSKEKAYQEVKEDMLHYKQIANNTGDVPRVFPTKRLGKKKRINKEQRKAAKKTAPTPANISPLEQALINRNKR